MSESDELSEDEGEQQPAPERSQTTSRAQSAAPPYYEQTHHAPPPPPSNNLSPAILYQAAMSYEIRHALTPSSPTTSSLSNANSSQSPTLRTTSQSNPSRGDVYPQPPGHAPYTQYPADQYTYHNEQQQHSSYGPVTHQQSQHYASGSQAGQLYGSGMYDSPRSSGNAVPYVQHAWGQRQGAEEGSSSSAKAEEDDASRRGGGGRRGPLHSPRSPFMQHEPPPSGLAALAMHAARIRPMSPLPNTKQTTVKTKSELESALGPKYSR